MIGIVDYGAGNLRSVRKALDYLKIENRILSGPADFSGIDKLILPGVGAFGAAMDKLHSSGLTNPVQQWLKADRPFLGICLGMQMLFESSEEAPGVAGLGIFAGSVPRFQTHKVPQIGWNQVRFEKETPLLAGLQDQAFFYFLHGYYCLPDDAKIVAGSSDYSLRYAVIVQQGNICAVQFHPEKSAGNGLTLLKNWARLAAMKNEK